MEEAEMIEELEKRGYRVVLKKKGEFKPFKAIHKPHGMLGSSVSEVEVIKEKPKTVVIKDKNGHESYASKNEIFEFSQEALDKYEEMWKKLKELDKQQDKTRDETWKFIDEQLKHSYKGTG